MGNVGRVKRFEATLSTGNGHYNDFQGKCPILFLISPFASAHSVLLPTSNLA